MPRDVTPGFEAAVAASVVRPVLLITGAFDSGTIRLWTGVGELSYGGNTYTGAGTILGIEPIMETTNLEANGTRISLTGIDSGVVSLALSEPYQGRLVTVYLALLNASYAVIADPALLFQGRADVMTINDDGLTCSIGMTVESRLIDLQRSRTRRYENADQQTAYPGDRGLEFVSLLQDQPFQWGPKAGTQND